MVTNSCEDSEKKPARQGAGEPTPEPNKIGASTPYDPVTFCYASLTL